MGKRVALRGQRPGKGNHLLVQGLVLLRGMTLAPSLPPFSLRNEGCSYLMFSLALVGPGGACSLTCVPPRRQSVLLVRLACARIGMCTELFDPGPSLSWALRRLCSSEGQSGGSADQVLGGSSVHGVFAPPLGR